MFPGFMLGTDHGTSACDTIVKNALRGASGNDQIVDDESI